MIARGANAAGWISYDFLVPAQENHTPRDWTTFGNWAGRTWGDLMADVPQVEFFYGDPGVPQLFNTWSVGLDNPRIAERAAE